ncbi:hypothetical protein GYW21_00245 [Lactobacillus mellis]|nr:hypothetical protein [Bombilactobacillus mellis]
MNKYRLISLEISKLTNKENKSLEQIIKIIKNNHLSYSQAKRTPHLVDEMFFEKITNKKL